MIHVLGDSFVNQGMVTSLRTVLDDPNISVTWDGNMGSTMVQEAARFAADTASHVRMLLVNDGGLEDSSADAISAMNDMVSNLQDHNYWLYTESVIHADNIIGSPGRTLVDAQHASIKAAFGERHVDTHQALLDASDGSAGDLEDVANGICPRSLRFDSQHLNSAGEAVTMTQVKLKMQALGWL